MKIQVRGVSKVFDGEARDVVALGNIDLTVQRGRFVCILGPSGCGSVLTRELRCGKPSCHCASGPGHLATYLTVSFAGGRTEQISLPAPLVAQAQEWVANYQAWWNAVEAVSAINRELLRRRRGTPVEVAPPPRVRRARTPRL